MVISILSIYAVPKWTISSQTLDAQARQVANDIRFAQGLSLTTGERYRWVKLSSTSYQITNSSGVAIPLAGGSSRLLTNGASFGTFANLPNNLIAFDATGTPYTDTASPGTALATVASISLANSGVTETIYITAETGLVVML